MKIKRILSWIAVGFFALAGLFSAGLGIFAAFSAPNAQPVMLRQPQQAYDRAQLLLQSLEAGDFQGAGELLWGQPSLGADRPAQDQAGQVIWEGFASSFSCEILGSCYPTESGVSLDVRITSLDLDSATASIGDRTRVLLQQRLDSAQNMDEIYDASGNYLDSLLQELMAQAAKEALAQESRFITRELILSMVHQDGQWWILPEPDLLEAISYGLLS